MQVHPREDGLEIDGVLVSESVMAEKVDAPVAERAAANTR